MAGCSNCDSNYCSCLIIGSVGDGTAPVTVTGSGDPDDPYVVSATVDICEAAGNLPSGAIAVPGTDRVMVVDGTTCTIKTLPVSAAGGGAVGIAGNTGAGVLNPGDTLNIVGSTHVQTAVASGPPGTTNVTVSVDESYTITGAVGAYSPAGPPAGVGGPYLVQSVVPFFILNNPSPTRFLDILFSLTIQGNVTCGGGGQQTADIWGYYSFNGAPASPVLHGFAGVNEITGTVPNANSWTGVAHFDQIVPPGGSILVGDMYAETISSVQVGSGQIDCACTVSWVGGNSQ